MLLEKREELLKTLKQRDELTDKISKLEQAFIEEIYNKTWKWGGQERHVQYINYAKNKVQLGKRETRPWDNDDWTVKTFTFEEFIEYYELDKEN